MFSRITALLAFTVIPFYTLGSSLPNPTLPMNTMEIEQPVPIRTCGNNPQLVINELDVEPFAPLKRGEETTVKFSGSLKSDITQGSMITVIAKFNGMKIMEKTLDICNTIRDVVQCPIKAGDFEFEDSGVLPSALPGGRYEVHLEAKGADKKTNIFCGTVAADVA